MFQKYYQIILIDIKNITSYNDGNIINEYDGEEVCRYEDTIVPLVGDVIHSEGESYIVQERHHSAESINRKLLLVEKIEETEQNLIVDDLLTP